ncbi:hypothetical protein BYT27DRAFT_6343419 [Phlegmacium glaucopus]|nr:hypothetical protein BYT27DRAFT_6343419 [Phlegmacium glaucopus]
MMVAFHTKRIAAPSCARRRSHYRRPCVCGLPSSPYAVVYLPPPQVATRYPPAHLEKWLSDSIAAFNPHQKISFVVCTLYLLLFV